MKLYRHFSLTSAFLFAAVGLLFLFVPEGVLTFLNSVSAGWGMAPSPVTGLSFYLVLAAAYMYVVTVLAFLMYRHPENRSLTVLLINAKLASSVLSLALFLLHGQYFVYLANCVIDGFIGISFWFLSFKAIPLFRKERLCDYPD